MLLIAENLRFSYGTQPVLKDVAVSLASSQIVALIGPNGSGKSTLLRSLIGHLPATGSINWQDRPLASWRHAELAREVAFLAQAPTFDPNDRVIDVLKLGRTPHQKLFGLENARDLEIVQSLAVQLELTKLLPRRMDELSGGQRQRVLIGRCLAQEPKALVLDEPNTYLDLKHQVDLCRLLRELATRQSIGILMALHDLNLAGMFADHLVLLKEGMVVASGPPGDVLDPVTLSQTYDVPLERVSREDGSPIIVPIAQLR